ncbi:MAG: hypothetical protein AB1571_03845 [Nanoarchaeota archaeon]
MIKMANLLTLLDIHRDNQDINIDNNITVHSKPIFHFDPIEVYNQNELNKEAKVLYRYNFDTKRGNCFPTDAFYMTYKVTGPRQVLNEIVNNSEIRGFNPEKDQMTLLFNEHFLYVFYSISKGWLGNIIKIPASDKSVLYVLSQVIFRRDMLEDTLNTKVNVKDANNNNVDFDNLTKLHFNYTCKKYKDELEVLVNAKKEGIGYEPLLIIGTKEINTGKSTLITTEDIATIH